MTCLKSGWIFQVKEEDVSDDDDGVQVEEALHRGHVPKDYVQVAHAVGKGPKDVPEY
jgi:hypothetical protein